MELSQIQPYAPTSMMCAEPQFMTSGATNVLIVDHNEVFRLGLTVLLADCGAMVKTSNDYHVLSNPPLEHQILILGISQSVASDVYSNLELRDGSGFYPPILCITSEPSRQQYKRLTRLGVAGYCDRNTASQILLSAVQKIAIGEVFLCPKLRERWQIDYRFAGLTKREAEILQTMMQVSSNQEIATLLGISVETVKTHVKNILVKLSVESRAQAIRKAAEILKTDKRAHAPFMP